MVIGISGGRIGGLAAIALRQKRHKVVVFELALQS
jgi:hypothetical protein